MARIPQDDRDGFPQGCALSASRVDGVDPVRVAVELQAGGRRTDGHRIERGERDPNLRFSWVGGEGILPKDGDDLQIAGRQ